MQQNNHQTELNLRYAEAFRLVKWHQRNVEARMAKDAMTLEALVRALEEPRGITKNHVASFRDYVRSIVRQELSGAA